MHIISSRAWSLRKTVEGLILKIKQLKLSKKDSKEVAKNIIFKITLRKF